MSSLLESSLELSPLYPTILSQASKRSSAGMPFSNTYSHSMPQGIYKKTNQSAGNAPKYRKKKLRFVNLKSPSKRDRTFFWQAFKGVLPFQYDLKPSAHSKRVEPLPREFFGACVAEPMDNAACQRAIRLIQDLGLGSVRLDLTYGQTSERIDKFVDGISALGVDVVLHLVQPVEVAERMTDASAQQEWKQFMQDSLERFSVKIKHVEVGTTINRAKWSGYSLDGFFALWHTSHEIARSNGVSLVGPNITDFEPQYNAGVLSMMRHANVLPDVHSNNLFAERAIEPEDYDRKILGPSLAKIHRYDLRKKIALIAAIASKYGLKRNWSTCAFWTLPRINRWLAWPEEQMADYLARYFVLCASAGSFERIFWGPLISFREGLVDDATFIRSDDDPTARDVVSYYANFAGDSDNWRCRPAYSALRTLCRELVGAVHSEAFFPTPKGLEVHAFEKEGRAIFVLWTRNGQCAKLNDCFSSADIEAVDYVLDRDGARSSKTPTFFGQSPIYISWPVGYRPSLKSSAQPIEDLVIALPRESFDYYDYDNGKWRGMVRAESAEAAKLLVDALSPPTISDNTEIASLRKARNAIWTVKDPRNTDRLLVVKKPIRMAWHKRILDRNKASKALRSWNGTSELMRRGINTPKVVAYFESKDPYDLMNNWFICEHFESRLNVRSFFSQYADGAKEVEGVSFSDFSEELVDFVYWMHQRGIFFRDLAGGNVLVDIPDQREIIFSLIDTARIRCLPWSMNKKRRIADLKRLALKLNSEQQIYFLNLYLERLGTHFNWRNRIGFKLFEIKVYLKRMKRRIRRTFSP